MAYQVTFDAPAGYYDIELVDGLSGTSKYVHIPVYNRDPVITEISADYNSYSLGAGYTPFIMAPGGLSTTETEILSNVGISSYESISPGDDKLWYVPSSTLIAGRHVIKVHSPSSSSGAVLWCDLVGKSQGDEQKYPYFDGTFTQDQYFVTYKYDGGTTNYSMVLSSTYVDHLGLFYVKTDASVHLMLIASTGTPYAIDMPTTGMQFTLESGATVDVGVATVLFYNSSVNPLPGGGQSSGGGTSYDNGSSSPYQYNTDGDTSVISGGDGTFTADGDEITPDDDYFDKGIGAGSGVWVYDLTYAKFCRLVQSTFIDTWQEVLKSLFNSNLTNAILRVYQTNLIPDDSLAERTIFLGSYDTGVTGQSCYQRVGGKLCDFDLSPFYGSFMDFSTDLYIFLPYVGFQPLLVDKYMGTTSQDASGSIYYRADFITGAITYEIYGKGISGSTSAISRDKQVLMDVFDGNMASDIPLGGEQMSRAASAIMGIASSAASATSSVIAAGANPAAALSGISSAIGIGTQAIEGLRRDIVTKGGATTAYGALTSKVPFFLQVRKTQRVANNLAHYIGYETNKTLQLSECSGFVQCDKVYLDSEIPEQDAKQVIAQLQAGVYI